jgi:hypothetical protein
LIKGIAVDVARCIAVAAGLLVAALAELMALGLAGAGHGWLAPAWFSLILFFVYPASLFRSVIAGRNAITFDVVMLVLALCTDLLVFLQTNANEVEYYQRAVQSDPTYVAVWLALWFGWQALTAVTILRKLYLAEMERG